MLAQRQMRVQQLVTNDYSINPVVARRDDTKFTKQ